MGTKTKVKAKPKPAEILPPELVEKIQKVGTNITIAREMGQVECVCAETYLSIKLRIIC